MKENIKLAIVIFLIITLSVIFIASFVAFNTSWMEWFFITSDGRMMLVFYVAFVGIASCGMSLEDITKNKH